MNKLGLFLCFLLAISYTQSEVIDGIDVNELYDKFTNIAKGLADNTEYKCSNLLINNKNKVLPKVEEVVRNLKDTNALPNALAGFALQLSMIDGFISDCNIASVVNIILTITKAEGIKQMGQNMIDNATELEGLFKDFTAATTEEGKLIVIGKIIRKITGITFH